MMAPRGFEHKGTLKALRILTVMSVLAGLWYLSLDSSSPPPSPPSSVSEPIQAPVPTASPEPARSSEPPTQAPVEPPAPSAQKSDASVESALLSAQRQALEALPSREELRRLTAEELHQTPVAVQNAARELGTVAQLLADHPEFAHSGLEFYSKCAEREDTVTSLRALCYANFQKWNDRVDAGALMPRVSPEVERLAQRVIR